MPPPRRLRNLIETRKILDSIMLIYKAVLTHRAKVDECRGVLLKRVDDHGSISVHDGSSSVHDGFPSHFRS